MAKQKGRTDGKTIAKKPKCFLRPKAIGEIGKLTANVAAAQSQVANAEAELTTYLRGVAHGLNITGSFRFDTTDNSLQEE